MTLITDTTVAATDVFPETIGRNYATGVVGRSATDYQPTLTSQLNLRRGQMSQHPSAGHSPASIEPPSYSNAEPALPGQLIEFRPCGTNSNASRRRAPIAIYS